MANAPVAGATHASQTQRTILPESELRKMRRHQEAIKTSLGAVAGAKWVQDNPRQFGTFLARCVRQVLADASPAAQEAYTDELYGGMAPAEAVYDNLQLTMASLAASRNDCSRTVKHIIGVAVQGANLVKPAPGRKTTLGNVVRDALHLSTSKWKHASASAQQWTMPGALMDCWDPTAR